MRSEIATFEEINLSRDALRRLVISLVLREQKTLRKKGMITADQALNAHLLGKSPEAIDQIQIDEATLGIDSLGTLDLILAMNRFFDLSTTGIEDYLLVKKRICDWIDLLQQHRELRAQDWSFGFETSGSTGTPKQIVQSANWLWFEMRAQAAGPLEHLSSQGRILSLVPPHHIYGFLFSCVLPDLKHMDVIDLHYAAPGAAFRHAQAGDLIVGTPFNWEVLCKTGQRFCDGVNGVTAAGPMRPATWQVIAENNLSRLTEIYGATETGGIGSRCSPDAPFELLPHLEQTDLGVRSKDGGSALILQDVLAWETARTFHVSGRLDAMVQVAGVNVSPALVKDRLIEVKGVADAVVRLGSDRLRAFIVPEAGHSQEHLEKRILAHVNSTLDVPSRPASYCFGPQVPRNEMGKLVDWP